MAAEAKEEHVVHLPGGEFVRLVDTMGDDLRVVNAARVSMHKEHTEFEEPADARLVGFLGRNGHWTPFSHPQVCLHYKIPISIARQWFKHMIGLTRNEVSRRYVKEAPEFYTPPTWRKGAKSIKQGSLDESVDEPDAVSEIYGALMKLCGDAYEKLLEEGVCAEQARFCLPQSMFTEFWETGSLAAYGRIASQRIKPDAQRETREVAEAVALLIAPRFPVAWKALTE